MHCNEDKWWPRCTVRWWICSCSRARVDKVLSIILHNLVLVRVATHENVHVQLSLDCSKWLKVPPGDYLMTVNQSDAEVPDLYNFILWELRHIYVEIALDCMHLRFCWREVLKPLEGLILLIMELLLTSLEPMLPGERTYWSLFGSRSSLNLSGMSTALWGIWRSPMINTN